MANIVAKVRELKDRITGATEDVPDNLIGTIITLTLLTLIGLGALVVLGYKVTNP
ncbi:MAG TPA: hypothetical protein VLR94_06605 [Acidobacteriota bacterium]|nr:hypothetical protein [Acidobacteriota bacterium]